MRERKTGNEHELITPSLGFVYDLFLREKKKERKLDARTGTEHDYTYKTLKHTACTQVKEEHRKGQAARIRTFSTKLYGEKKTSFTWSFQ